jgi:hypothetical protein
MTLKTSNVTTGTSMSGLGTVNKTTRHENPEDLDLNFHRIFRTIRIRRGRGRESLLYKYVERRRKTLCVAVHPPVTDISFH